MTKQTLVLSTETPKNAQQDRKGAVEHNRRKAELPAVASTPKASRASSIWDRICMFLAGACAALAVHFFDDVQDLYLIGAILLSVLWMSISLHLRRKAEDAKGRYQK